MRVRLKICLVAEGEADMYPRLGPTMEWDTSAAHPISIESGATLERYINDNTRKAPKHNKIELLNGSFTVFRGVHKRG
jgi:3'(2'), 5'-bisphosphate nucleotidase